MNAMYSAEQINIPPELGVVLKQFTKAAIRDAPKEDVYKWAANYFAGIAGQPLPFDNGGRLVSQEKGGPPRSAETGAQGPMVSEVMQDAGGFEEIGGGAADAQADAVVQQLFAQYDPQGTGRLERAALPALLVDMRESLGLDLNDEQAQDIVNMLDVDEDNTVELDELRNLLFASGDV